MPMSSLGPQLRKEEKNPREEEKNLIIKDGFSYAEKYGPQVDVAIPSIAQTTYIYALCDPRPLYSFVYVGCTDNNPVARMYQHLAEATAILLRQGQPRYRSHSPKNKWLRRLHEAKLLPVVCTLMIVSQRSAIWAEHEWIRIIAERFDTDCLNVQQRKLGTKSKVARRKGQRRDKPALPIPPPSKIPLKPTCLLKPLVLTPVHPAFYEENEESVVYCPIAPEKGPT